MFLTAVGVSCSFLANSRPSVFIVVLFRLVPRIKLLTSCLPSRRLLPRAKPQAQTFTFEKTPFCRITENQGGKSTAQRCWLGDLASAPEPGAGGCCRENAKPTETRQPAKSLFLEFPELWKTTENAS